MQSDITRENFHLLDNSPETDRRMIKFLLDHEIYEMKKAQRNVHKTTILKYFEDTPINEDQEHRDFRVPQHGKNILVDKIEHPPIEIPPLENSGKYI